MYTFNIIEIIVILLVHWVADFIFQTDYQAKNKSKSFKALTDHTKTYSFIWFVFGVIITNPFYTILGVENWYKVWIFVFITFVVHTITDYFTSKLNSKLWASGQTHNFFASIGFDQITHYIQLFLTYGFLKNL